MAMVRVAASKIPGSPNDPAAKAGLQGSSQRMSRNGQVVVSGGDVIVGVGGQLVTSFEDLVSYIFDNTQIGQTITLTVLRKGKQQMVPLTLSTLSTGK